MSGTGVLTRKGGAVLEGTRTYEAAIGSEEERVALNGLAQQRIERARQQRHEKVFTSKGVDALGSTRRYMNYYAYFGEDHPKTKEADRVFEADVETGLFEEIEKVHEFCKKYPIIGGDVMMADIVWDDLTANGSLDERADGWYLGRSFLDVRESLVFRGMLKTGESESHGLLTISNRSTAENADEYGLDSACMIRYVSTDHKNQACFDQLMMKDVPEWAVEELYQRLQVPIDTVTIQDTPDSSTKYLATQIKVEKRELQHAAADIAFLIDCIMSERTGQPHLFGERVEVVEGNPYAEIFERSRRKEIRRKQATKVLKERFKQLVVDQPVNVQEELRRAFEEARSIVADIEGVEFVRERYGERAAEAYLCKKEALEEGSWNDTESAERIMQHEMGDVVVCGQRLTSDSSKGAAPSSLEDLLCRRLPEPGEKASCPGCRRMVTVAGSKEAIKCSKLDCKLVDPKLKRKHEEKQQKAKKQAAMRRKELERKKKQQKAQAESKNTEAVKVPLPQPAMRK